MALGAVVCLAASWLVALHRPLFGWELRLTTLLNAVPGAVALVAYPVMQLGTFAGVALAALLVYVWQRRVSLVVATVASGTVAWFAAKLVKRLVERGRPPEYLPDLVLRDPHVSGLGYLSGHSALAASLAVLLLAAAPRRWRPVIVAVATAVGLARIVYGVHFPADVVGGWSLGVLVGLGGLALLERRERGVTAASD